MIEDMTLGGIGVPIYGFGEEEVASPPILPARGSRGHRRLAFLTLRCGDVRPTADPQRCDQAEAL
jgi:hypothetical protein